jgi:hypothetical protein
VVTTVFLLTMGAISFMPEMPEIPEKEGGIPTECMLCGGATLVAALATADYLKMGGDSK